MKLKVKELSEQAVTFMADRRYLVALRLQTAILRRVPEDFQTRLQMGDALVAIGAKAEAMKVYGATANLCIDGGRPLVAIIACRAMKTLGASTGKYLSRLAAVYGRGSSRLADIGARINISYGDFGVDEKELRRERTVQELVAEAVSIGAQLETVVELPPKLPKAGLLSKLSPMALIGLIRNAVVHRLPAGHRLINAGDSGDSCFMLAAGQVRVFSEDDVGQQREIAQLGSGAIFGEMALLTGSQRSATVETIEATEAIEIGPKALAAVEGEIDVLIGWLQKTADSRWMNNLLEQSSMFRIFDADQKRELLKRFSAHEISPGTTLYREGEKSRGIYLILKGEIEISRKVSGRRATLKRLRAGAMLGVTSSLGDRAAGATATAASAATVLFLPGSRVRRLSAALPEFVQAVGPVAMSRTEQLQAPLPNPEAGLQRVASVH